MPKLLLTDRLIPSLRPPTRLTYCDTKTAGLVLRVAGPTTRNDSRARVWSFLYRYQGKREALKLGLYPSMTLKAARIAVNEARARLDKGDNPAAARRTTPPAPAAVYTFADFVPVFVAFQKTQKKKKSWAHDEAKIKQHLLPTWGDRALASFTRRDCQALLDQLTAAGLTVGVNRVQALISRIFTVALDRELIDHHPATRIMKRFTETPGTRVLTDQELCDLWARLDAHPGLAADGLRLRLLLGQRGAETVGLPWAELDLEAGIWRLPGTRTKNGLPHWIGLPPTAWRLLLAWRTACPVDEPRVFPGLRLNSRAHSDLAALHDGAYTWRDLRRTVATRLGDLGYDDAAIDRIQNRARTSVTAKVYNHAQYVEQIRGALTAWDVALARVLKGEAMVDRGKVLPFVTAFETPPRS